MSERRRAMARADDSYVLLVLGSGAAGLSVVLRALELNPNLKIAVIAKNAAAAGSTTQAQGGIAAVFDSSDSLESHVADTMDGGAGLCDPVTVRYVTERARGDQLASGRGSEFRPRSGYRRVSTRPRGRAFASPDRAFGGRYRTGGGDRPHHPARRERWRTV